MSKTFVDYEDSVLKLAVYPNKGKLLGLLYTVLGLTGEAGEFADKIKKVLRDEGGVISADKEVELKKELGDVLWYLASAAKELGSSLEEIAEMNENKLWDRAVRNKLHGSGDDR